MWPLRIENPIFLQTIYGNYPDLSSVEVTKAEINRDGPSMYLSFISTVLPYRPPAKWAAFNAVSFGLEFIAVESISLRSSGAMAGVQSGCGMTPVESCLPAKGLSGCL
ncbi:Imm50 family immunity protein [Mesorhizobium sp. M0816]|uniref:Imm50 family immunity protein n=1 Tax=Mesorhizobium sp. M0816 TaxID=2957006 RepID=UPI00333DED34